MINLIILVLTASAPIQNYALPGEIDPLDPHSGDFLDLNLISYKQLGIEAYSEENYGLASRYFLAFLSRNISDVNVIYDLACCYALMEEPELAALYLRRAVNAGYSDFDYILEDHDFDTVRDTPAFMELMDQISRIHVGPPEYTGESILFDARAAFRCLIRFPEDFDDSEQAYTLLIGLHGFGDSPESFIRLWGYFESPDFIYACPCAPYPITVNGISGYSWFRMGADSIETSELDMISAGYVEAAVDNLSESYNISDVFLFGFSQGCGLTWLTGLRYPDEFSGLIGFGGRFDTAFIPESVIENVSGMNAFVANGTLDESVDFAEGAHTVEMLESYGMEVVFKSWNGPHRVSRSTLLEAQEWMKDLIQKTRSIAVHFCWRGSKRSMIQKNNIRIEIPAGCKFTSQFPRFQSFLPIGNY